MVPALQQDSRTETMTENSPQQNRAASPDTVPAALATACSALPQTMLAMLLLSAVSLSSLMPVAWGWENGVIENSEVLVLALGAAMAVTASCRAALQQRGRLGAILAPVWVILIGRELSWGAACLPPVGFTDGEPVYSSALLWYKPLVGPVAVALLLGCAIQAWRHRLPAACWRALSNDRSMLLPLLIGGLAAIGSTFSEGKLGVTLPFSHGRAEVLEELLELIAYCALVRAQYLLLKNIAAFDADLLHA